MKNCVCLLGLVLFCLTLSFGQNGPSNEFDVIIRGGTVYGASDKIGAYPASNPVAPVDLVSTIYHLLGVDPRQSLSTADGRPVRISQEGRAISELVV